MTTRSKGPLRIAIEDFLETFDLGALFHKWTVSVIDRIEDEFYTLAPRILDAYGASDLAPAIFDNIKEKRGKQSAPAFLMTVIMSLAGMIIGVVSGATRPAARLAEYHQDVTKRTFRPPVRDLVMMYRLGLISQDQYLQWFADQGIPDQVTISYQEMSKRTPDISQTLALWLRGYITDADRDRYFLREGVTPDLVNNYLDLAKQIPGPSDLVRMAVREAWNEQVVSRFQYDADYPPEFSEWMTKQGYSDEWAKRFWRAHWDLPGLTQCYEMLHRLREGTSETPFTLADMETVLKTADIPEFFRRRLIAISYSPYTRVDVRRLYARGLITRDDVKSNYLDMGYDDDHAEKLTQFTVTTEAAEDKGLSRETVGASYRRGLIGRDEAIARIVEMGYSDQDADFYLDVIDFDMAEDLIGEQLKDIEARFISGELDEVTVMGKLGPLNLPSDRLNRVLSLWAIKRRNRQKVLSRSELETLYEHDLITQADLLEGLKRDGYREDDARLIISRIDLDMADQAAKESERAEKEAERTAASARTKDSVKARAVIDAQIAELRLELANIKVAGHAELTPDQVDSLRQAADQATIAIAQLQLVKAQIKAEG